MPTYPEPITINTTVEIDNSFFFPSKDFQYSMIDAIYVNDTLSFMSIAVLIE